VLDVFALAQHYRVRVEFADLGDWGAATLVSEYEPGASPVIRINRRLTGSEAFVELAVAHELYHHREAIGEVRRLPNRAAREAAADGYARAVVPGAHA